jgi:hypothetical protein
MNDSYNYLYPVFAMIFLTFLVFGKLFYDRVSEMKARKLRMSVFATSKGREYLENVKASDNFKNLFEAPVLFYLLICLLLVLNIWRPLYLYLMWAYVVTRYAHSTIHCTYNKVMHRFYAFASSVFILVTLWLIFFAEVVLLGNRHV